MSKTKEESMHMESTARLGCIACRLEGRGCVPAEIHHIKNGTMGKRSSHFSILPLCPSHHRGTDHPNTASIHLSPKVFVAKYGSEISLWHEVQGLLNQSISEDF